MTGPRAPHKNDPGDTAEPYGLDHRERNDKFIAAMKKAGVEPHPAPTIADGKVIRSLQPETFVPTASSIDNL